MFGSQAVRDASELYELHIALHSLSILYLSSFFHIDQLASDCSKDIFYFRILFESRPSIIQNMLRQQLRDCLCSLLVLCGSPFIFTLQCPHIAFMSSNCERILNIELLEYILIYVEIYSDLFPTSFYIDLLAFARNHSGTVFFDIRH